MASASDRVCRLEYTASLGAISRQVRTMCSSIAPVFIDNPIAEHTIGAMIHSCVLSALREIARTHGRGARLEDVISFAERVAPVGALPEAPLAPGGTVPTSQQIAEVTRQLAGVLAATAPYEPEAAPAPPPAAAAAAVAAAPPLLDGDIHDQWHLTAADQQRIRDVIKSNKWLHRRYDTRDDVRDFAGQRHRCAAEPCRQWIEEGACSRRRCVFLHMRRAGKLRSPTTHALSRGRSRAMLNRYHCGRPREAESDTADQRKTHGSAAVDLCHC